jgi:hypothetical protein
MDDDGFGAVDDGASGNGTVKQRPNGATTRPSGATFPANDALVGTSNR